MLKGVIDEIMHIHRQIFLLLTAICLLCGCALLSSVKSVFEEPKVNFQDFKITDIDFTSITTAFNFKVTNPNPIGIRVDGFEYRFIIEENEFLSGNNPNSVGLAAKGESFISIPIALKYIEVYEAVTALAKNKGSIPYTIAGKFFFNTPIGKIPIPFSKSGELPVLKMPKIDVENIYLENLSLTKADIIFKLKFDNPNIFSITLDNFSYNLSLNKQQLAEGITAHTQIAEKSTNALQIPISLNFLEIGRAAHSILTQKEVNYQLKGAANLITPFKKIDLPYEKIGKIDISKVE
jgi:LEA14-like dessication related protein